MNGIGVLEFELVWVDVIDASVDKIDSHAHVAVNENLVVLVKFDGREVIFRCFVVRIKPVVEEFRLDWDEGLQVRELVPWLELISLSLLELLVTLGRSSCLLQLLVFRRLSVRLLHLLIHLILLAQLLLNLLHLGHLLVLRTHWIA